MLTLPVHAGFMWYHYTSYIGVINPPWPLLMVAVALTGAMFVTDMVSLSWKIIINCSLAAVIVLPMVLALPNYTLSEARDAIAQDLGQTVSHASHQTLKIIPVMPNISLFVDHDYVFEVIEGSKLTTYSFNPVTGE